MSEQQIPAPIPTQPTAQDADPALSSPVPPAEQPDKATPAAEAPSSSTDAAGSDPLAEGGLATFTVVNSEGFEQGTPCLVLDTFEHDGADGEDATFAHVILLPPVATVRREQLAPYRD